MDGVHRSSASKRRPPLLGRGPSKSIRGPRAHSYHRPRSTGHNIQSTPGHSGCHGNISPLESGIPLPALQGQARPGVFHSLPVEVLHDVLGERRRISAWMPGLGDISGWMAIADLPSEESPILRAYADSACRMHPSWLRWRAVDALARLESLTLTRLPSLTSLGPLAPLSKLTNLTLTTVQENQGVDATGCPFESQAPCVGRDGRN